MLAEPEHKLLRKPGPEFFSRAGAADQSWRGYNEDLTSNCDQRNDGKYAMRHNPAAYYTTL